MKKKDCFMKRAVELTNRGKRIYHKIVRWAMKNFWLMRR
jgi:hypothetical protein